MRDVEAVKQATEQARIYRIAVMQHYRRKMAKIAGRPCPPEVVREQYTMGRLPAVFPLPAVAMVAEWSPIYGGHWRTFDKNQPHTSRVWLDDWGIPFLP